MKVTIPSFQNKPFSPSKRTSPQLFAIFTCLLLSIHAGSSQNLTWAKNLVSSNSFSNVTSMAVDINSNVYLAGIFNDTVDFDPGPAVHKVYGNNSVFILKIDSAGNYIWSRTFDTGTASSISTRVEVDLSDNVYLAGNFTDTVDFDPGIGVFHLISSSYDMFVLKLDASGSFDWVKSIQSTNIIPWSMDVDANGNIYPAGSFSGQVDFDPGPDTTALTAVGSNGFILKFDTDGNYIWVKEFQAASSAINYSISIDNSGNIYTAGRLFGAVDFDPGIGSYILIDTAKPVYICKLDPSGNFLWATSYKADFSLGNLPYIQADPTSGVLITGSFLSTVDFDPGVGIHHLSSNGGADVYLMKLNNDGTFAWAKSIGGSGDDEGNAVAIGLNGNIHATGFAFGGLIDFDPGASAFHINCGFGTAYMLSLNPNGDFIWAGANTQTSSGFSKGKFILSDYENNICAAGQFNGFVDFDPGSGVFEMSNQFGSGVGEIYVQKLSAPNTIGLSPNENTSGIQLYPNPVVDFLNIHFNAEQSTMDIMVYNETGQIILRNSSFHGQDCRLDFRNLTSGIYFIRMETARGVESWKIVKQ